jgi:hypothetical protein
MKQERNGEPLEALRDTFEQALNLGIMLQPRSATTPIVDLFMSGAAFEGRHASNQDQGSEHPVLATVKRGLEAVNHCQLQRARGSEIATRLGLTYSEHIW